MNISTLTQKGQVVIPKHIRQILGVKPGDSVRYSVQNERIYIEPVLSVDEAVGMFADKQRVSEKTENEAIEEGIIEAFKEKENHGDT